MQAKALLAPFRWFRIWTTSRYFQIIALLWRRRRQMAKSPSEPTDLVREQPRLLRAELNARFDTIDVSFRGIETLVAALKKDLRGLNPNTRAKIYNANLRVESFADHERRSQALERRRDDRGA